MGLYLHSEMVSFFNGGGMILLVGVFNLNRSMCDFSFPEQPELPTVSSRLAVLSYISCYWVSSGQYCVTTEKVTAAEVYNGADQCEFHAAKK